MAGTTWPDLVAGRTAKASEVESKFDWLEGNIVPMNSGTTTDLAYDLGTETKRWRYGYVSALNPTSTAGGIAIGTTTANASTVLDISGVKALRIPRLSSTQRDALTGADGMLIFNSSTSQLQVFRNAAWGNIGGTVFRTQPVAETTTSAAGTTVTALNITSGGGRLNGLRFRSSGSGGETGNIRVYLDGTLVLNFSGVAGSALDFAIGAAGDAVSSPLTSTSAYIGGTTTAGEIAPSLNWDFATSCAIYIYPGAGANTVSTKYVHSLVV